MHHLTGQHHRLDRVGQFIDIEHRYPAHTGNLVKVVIIGDNRRLDLFGHVQKLFVHTAQIVIVLFADFHAIFKFRLQIRDDVQSSSASGAFEIIAVIRQKLKLPDDKHRNDHLPFNKTGTQNIADSPVDNHAGIEKFRLRDGFFSRDAQFAGHAFKAFFQFFLVVFFLFLFVAVTIKTLLKLQEIRLKFVAPLQRNRHAEISGQHIDQRRQKQ